MRERCRLVGGSVFCHNKAIVCLISFVKWFVMDEDEKERHKPFRMIKKIIIVTIIAELITTLFKIFGLQ